MQLATVSQTELVTRYRAIRRATEALCRPLRLEDHLVQPYDHVSPPKWHLAHTTWFFETLVLLPHLDGYRAFDGSYAYLFNSYYESQGSRADKARRGTYSRPTVEEVLRWRHLVDMAVEDLLGTDQGRHPDLASLVELGLHHEQQHQELLLYDIKAILHHNPARPAYEEPARADWSAGAPVARSPGKGEPPWIPFGEGIREIGFAGTGFAFDNEKPRHLVYLAPFSLARHAVTNGEYAAFIEDGGYRRAELWLSDGWAAVQREGWRAPAYWEPGDRGDGEGRLEYGFRGMEPLDPAAPVRHVSYYEAEAFARWSGARLPNEAEWEAAVAETDGLRDIGANWEWTGSAYLPYPGFRPHAGIPSEYNGKFMIDQMVLRGGSLATPAGHWRPTYRNFFQAALRWQFAGIRLARDP